MVQIFQPLYFPVNSNGGVSEILISPGEDIHLNMYVNSLLSESSVRSYSVLKRKCYFEDENFEQYGDHYSYSECLSKCKLRSIEALCSCVPFYTPVNILERNETVIYCSLAHVACLERYRGKLKYQA